MSRNLRNKKVRLDDYADRTCRKCWGKGFLGIDRGGSPILCVCFLRNYRKGRKTTRPPGARITGGEKLSEIVKQDKMERRQPKKYKKKKE